MMYDDAIFYQQIMSYFLNNYHNSFTLEYQLNKLLDNLRNIDV